MKKVGDIMLDLETLGVNPGCVILSIGAVVFDPRQPWTARGPETALGDWFHGMVDVASCENAGLVQEPGSVKFWSEQSPAARLKAFGGQREPLRSVLQSFSAWFRSLSPDGTANVWCQGANFDVPILQAAYRACGMDVPWHYRSPRDTRTVYDLAGIEHRGQKHDALDDCYEQCEAVCQAFGILGFHHKEAVRCETESEAA